MMVITDLDGTLLRNDRTVSPADRATLEALGARGVLRVVATGRNLASVRRVLPPDFPIDYVIFSTGSGVLDWRRESILLQHGLSAEAVHQLFGALSGVTAELQLHARIPDNHHFVRYMPSAAGPRRVTDWDQSCCERAAGLAPHEGATQFLLLYPPEPKAAQEAAFERVRSSIGAFRAVRVTSPRDPAAMWIEIFSRDVSKSQAAAWLARRHGIPVSACLSVGNDYNDRDLLLWSGRGVAVGNAIPELREGFPVVASNEQDGFSEAVRSYLPD